ncbi:protein crumbs homolog 3a [Osmerus eperlanus]|uniref:protein crumbs homolog 3a n=1 Tax=Osmerus eperlanus TaxID=29151 RepID=UPI002E13675C
MRPSWCEIDMAQLLDIIPMPGLLARSILLLVLAINHAEGQNDSTTSPPRTFTTTSASGPNIAAIVAPTVILGLLAIASAVLAWLFCVVKKRRQTEGTYHPSAEEQSGTRSVEAPDTLKLPKEERLI